MIALIPKPRNLTILPGEILLSAPITLSGDDRTQPIQEHFASSYGSIFRAKGAGSAAQISLKLVEELKIDLGGEGYQLDISGERITIQAPRSAGLFYGMQTVRQLLPTEGSDGGISIPCMSIVDKPRFKWRGFMLDEARHFFGMETIKKVLDWLAFFNLNVFHWHLTDYQGWRVEINQYPRLTDVGGRRAGSQTTSFSKKYRGMDMTPHEGWYTQDEIREIIRYATERHITIVPEVDLPGHFGAALAAYPHLGCTKEEMEVRTEWGIFKDVACIGSQETREFLHNVLDEFCGLFPGPYIHLGGDEVETEQWEACPECQRVKEENNLGNFAGLNSLIMNDLGAYLKQKGKTPIVWNEALQATLDKRTVIMHWTPGPLSLLRTKRALMKGYQVIFQTFWESYFDYAHSFIPMRRVYRAKTLDNISPAAWSGVLGVQGALWTEFVEDEERLQWNSFPRLAAKAEVGWSQSGDRNYRDFSSRWEKLRGHLKTIGLHNPAPLEVCDPSIYRRSMALAQDVLKDMQAEQKRWQLKQIR
jgi:hexosaminidase